MKRTIVAAVMIVLAAAGTARSQWRIDDLPKLTPGKTAAQNALWGENPKDQQFLTTRRVVIADIRGPAVITMIHFALPNHGPLGREAVLRFFWDGEETPSVECPLVDFFGDPAGARGLVNSALVNKNRGYNAYFPMPFAKSARLEVVYDGPLAPSRELWARMPCYSYVMYRTLEKPPEDTGYFHAQWRQEYLPLGKRDYTALEAAGSGKFVGWNVTVRLPGRPGYPVDENEKFYIDGEAEASIEFQGLEDSFGFSWGFPKVENMFPLTGWFPFKEGAAAYRFFINDAIRFEKSLRVAIGFGKNENPIFEKQFSAPGNELEFSSVCYWYQTEPHAAFPSLPSVDQRMPRAWDEPLPSADELKKRGVRLDVRCGRPVKEVVFAEKGYGAAVVKGEPYAGFPPPVYYCRSDTGQMQIDLTVPKRAAGTVRVFVIDPDQFGGGRREEVFVAGKSLGIVEGFTKGKWLEAAVGPDETAHGKVTVEAKNVRPGSNAVISIIEWVEKGSP